MTEKPWITMTSRERRDSARAAVRAGLTASQFGDTHALPARTAHRAVAHHLHHAASDELRRAQAAEHIPASPVRVMELTAERCRWPLWAHDAAPPGPESGEYCGAPATEGWSYCEHHARLARKYPEPRDPETRASYRRL